MKPTYNTILETKLKKYHEQHSENMYKHSSLFNNKNKNNANHTQIHTHY